MKRFVVTAVMLLSSAMLFITPVSGDDSIEVPVKGMWSGTDYAVGHCTNGADLVVNVGKGVSTIGGKSDLLSVSCLDCTRFPSCSSSGWMILTASNGDVLHLEVIGTFNLLDGSWTEEEEVVGGTGRFESAEGHGTTTGRFIFSSDLFPFDADPSIPPDLLREPSSWVGTTEGWITY